MTTPSMLNRRSFLKAGAATGAGLVVGMYLPTKELWASEPPAGKFSPSAWLTITAENQVTIHIGKSEMGQGILTSLAMLIAEELDVAWNSIRVEKAMLDPNLGNQGTGGSTSIRTLWEPLRKIGAGARAMLIAAAAEQWSVTPQSCSTEDGWVLHAASKRRASYGSLAAAASKKPFPKDVKLKDPKNFRILGKSTHRVDAPEKTDGSAQFGIDMRVPGMLYATVAQSPVFGGKVAKFDDARARQIPGVKQVVEVNGGVGVIADSFWQALQARRALEITWDEGPNAKLNSQQINQILQDGAAQPGVVAKQTGDAKAALAGASKKLEAAYETPMLAHATMEPMNCTAHVRADGCEVWSPTQFPSLIREFGAQALGLRPESIQVHITLMGGGFGRRAMPDFSLQAMQLSKAANAPVKLVWTREDDMQHDYYRPPTLHRLSAALDAGGTPTAWTHHLIAPSIHHAVFGDQGTPEKDYSVVDTANELPYAIPNQLIRYTLVQIPVPIGWWRSVFAAQNGYAQECFVDELAQAAGKDPLDFRLALLKESPRHKAVLELAAEKAGWSKALPQGRTRGIALVKSFDTYVAQVAEISYDNSDVRVHRVVCAVDCGFAVNPNAVEAQMQGAVVYGLSAALRGVITLDQGRVQQGNFDSYQILRMHEMPHIEVHVVPSQEHPGGMGEPGVPPIAPAVANAVFAATRKPARSLPLHS